LYLKPTCTKQGIYTCSTYNDGFTWLPKEMCSEFMISLISTIGKDIVHRDKVLSWVYEQMY